MMEKKRRISTSERSPSGEGVVRSDGKYSFRALRKKRLVYFVFTENVSKNLLTDLHFRCKQVEYSYLCKTVYQRVYDGRGVNNGKAVWHQSDCSAHRCI